MNDLVSLVLNTFFPTLMVSFLAFLIGFYSLWHGITKKDKPSQIEGLALVALGFSYVFSYFGWGDTALRHALIRFSVVWVIISIGFSQYWRSHEYK